MRALEVLGVKRIAADHVPGTVQYRTERTCGHEVFRILAVKEGQGEERLCAIEEED